MTEAPGERGRTPPADDLPEGWVVDSFDVSDIDEALEIERASFSNPWSRKMFEWELQNEGVSYCYVLRTPVHRVAAFCTTWRVADEVHVNNLAVRPELRGRGAGRHLLVSALRHGSAAGARRATLEVRRSNAVARKLYEGLGFTVAGTRRNYYTDPEEDALVLWLDRLPSPGPPAAGHALESPGSMW